MRRLPLLLLCSLAFGSIGIFRNSITGVDSATLAFIRVGFSLIAFKVLFGNTIKPPKSPAVMAAYAISGLCIAIASTLYLEAFEFAKVSDVVLIGFLDPMLVMLLSSYALKERITKYSILSIVFALGGMMALLNTPSEIRMGDVGAILAALAVLAGGINTVLTRWEEKQRQTLGDVLFYPFAFAAAFLFLPGVANMGALTHAGAQNALLALALGAATAAGHIWHDSLMLKWGAHLTELATRVGITVAGVTMSVLLLSQPISGGWWAAAALFFISAVLIYHEAMLEGKPHVRKMHAHTV